MRLPTVLAWAALFAAQGAFATWSDPVQVASMTSTLGCGPDSGLAIHRISAGGREYLLKSSSALRGSTLAIAGRSIVSGKSLTVFTLVAQTPTGYSHRTVDGACATSSAVEALGLSLSHATQPVSIAPARTPPAPALRVVGNRVELGSEDAYSISDVSGRLHDLASTLSGSQRILDLSPLPSGIYLLRVGRDAMLIRRL